MVAVRATFPPTLADRFENSAGTARCWSLYSRIGSSRYLVELENILFPLLLVSKAMDLSFGLEDTHVLVTGGAGLIGTTVVKAFIAAGAKVSSLDIAYTKDQAIGDSDNPLTIHADTTDEHSLFGAFELAYLKNGPVQVCVALAALDLSALPHHASAADMSLEQFRRTIDVNVVGTFATSRQWLRGLKFWSKEHGLTPLLPNVSLIIVGSESGHW